MSDNLKHIFDAVEDLESRIESGEYSDDSCPCDKTRARDIVGVTRTGAFLSILDLIRTNDYATLGNVNYILANSGLSFRFTDQLNPTVNEIPPSP